MPRSECPYGLPGSIQTIAPSGGEIAGQTCRLERVWVAGDDRSGFKAAEELRQKDYEPSHDGRLGVGAKVTPSVADFRDEPYDRHAARHAVRINSIGGSQGRNSAGTIYQ